MTMCAYWITSAICLLLLVSVQARTILVVQPGQTDQPNRCSSLECVGDYIGDTTEVRFTTSHIFLNTTVFFKNHSNIAFIGLNGVTTISCKSMALSSHNDNGTGLQFIGVTNLTMRDLFFERCGSRDTFYKATIVIRNSTNLFIRNITIMYSDGSGMVLIEARKAISIENALFLSNSLEPKARVGGGGVFILFNQLANVTFVRCRFENNSASEGGGALVVFNDEASNHSISIDDSIFVNNSATWGAGMRVIFRDLSQFNTLVLINTTFCANNASKRAGGGIEIGYGNETSSAHMPHNNTIAFNNCIFTKNNAESGGAVSIFSAKSTQCLHRKDVILFKDCKWFDNTGMYGDAVDMTPEARSTLSDGWIPLLVKFENCNFTRNYWPTKSLTAFSSGRGCLLATGFSIEFKGEVHFANNNLSAIYLVGSMMDFAAGTRATFKNNFGYDGGAIALIGFSAMRVRDNSTFVFTENKADWKGGAIFFSSIDGHDFISSRSCFIQYKGNKSVENRNISFIFRANSAKSATSIFASSVLPCYYSCSNIGYPNSSMAPFSCIGRIDYSNELNQTSKVSTLGRYFNRTVEDHTIIVVPGKEIKLPVVLEDEFNATVNGFTYARVMRFGVSSNFSIALDKAYSYVYQGRIRVYGRPNDTGTIELTTSTVRKVTIRLQVRMLECPPGYVIKKSPSKDNTIALYMCLCSAITNNRYMGITNCSTANFQAYIVSDYWAGYQSDGNNLITGYCPFGLCGHSSNTTGAPAPYLLPSNASNEELQDTICNPNRKGVLCGSCKKGYSVFYHARHFECEMNTTLCRIGPLLYFVSELLPLTVFFVVVMVFNISFTSGVANSFILFAQLYEVTVITADGSIWIDKIHLWRFFETLHFIYRNFNFEFFTLNKLSFCLWEGANSLDILSVKYITVAYGLLLIIFTVLFLNICNFYHRCHYVANPSRVRGFIIHGLTAFLVLCYSHCTKVTFEILTPAGLYSINKVPVSPMVVQRYGDIEYFSSVHLKYAIPAIVCLFTVVLPPPLLLILYPVHYRLLSFLRISETKFAQWLSLPLVKIKPLFDSFQGCFKDECRFFAGLYFFFRLLTEVIDAFTLTNPQYYTMMVILIASMIAALSLSQPYQKRWHNTLDTLIFLDMLIIHSLSLYNNTLTHTEYDTTGSLSLQDVIDGVSAFQAVLSILPLVYIIAYVTGLQVSSVIKPKKREEEFEIPARLVPESDSDSSSEYCEFVEDTM